MIANVTAIFGLGIIAGVALGASFGLSVIPGAILAVAGALGWSMFRGLLIGPP